MYMCQLEILYAKTHRNIHFDVSSEAGYQNFGLKHERKFITSGSGPEVKKLYTCSTQLSTTFQQLLIKTKIQTNKVKFLALSLSDVVFIMQINHFLKHLLAR